MEVEALVEKEGAEEDEKAEMEVEALVEKEGDEEEEEEEEKRKSRRRILVLLFGMPCSCLEEYWPEGTQ